MPTFPIGIDVVAKTWTRFWKSSSWRIVPPLVVCQGNILCPIILVHICSFKTLKLSDYFSVQGGGTCHFYPTALKGCLSIVFTHGVRMGGWAA